MTKVSQPYVHLPNNFPSLVEKLEKHYAEREDLQKAFREIDSQEYLRWAHVDAYMAYPEF